MQRHAKAWQSREKRQDARVARLCALVANCNRDHEKKKDPFTVSDFMPKTRSQIRREEREASKAHQLLLLEQFRVLAAALAVAAAKPSP